ncbi:MAG: serine protease [Rhodospirillaceae bacterium]|nr:serine protease [Rhodospirillaceae bacterium]
MKNVVYLYPSRDAAEKGERFGGTGFLVGIASTASPHLTFLYAVTNYHVAISNGCSVVRVNRKDGQPDIFEFGPEDWHFDAQAGHDVAVVQIPLRTNHDFLVLPHDGCLSRELRDSQGIAPGDDIFIVGRFIDHDGETTNRPAIRFGHISINQAPIPTAAFRKPVATYCLDTNSRTGYSGSPVWVYRTPFTDLQTMVDPSTHGKMYLSGRPMLYLLGIHTGQFSETWEMLSDAETAEVEKLIKVTKTQIRGLSGMTLCTPAWAILDLLNSPKLKNARDLVNGMLENLGAGGVPVAVMDKLNKALGFDLLKGQ